MENQDTSSTPGPAPGPPPAAVSPGGTGTFPVAKAASAPQRLRTRLIRAMVGTLAIVSGSTLLTVGYLNIRTARETQDTIEAQIRQSITRKGQGLATNHALALRGLVADNAFGDVARLVERAVREDREMVYGLFLSADGRPWTYVPPLSTLGAPDGAGAGLGSGETAGLEGAGKTDWRHLGIAPETSRVAGPRSSQRVIDGQKVFEFSAAVDAEDGAILGRIYYGLSSVPLDQALSSARHDLRRSLIFTLLLLGVLGAAAMLLGVLIIRNLSRRITGPLAHLTDVITAIAAGHKNERVTIQSQDEIGALGRAFNRMLEKLDDSYLRMEALNRTLEQRVDDRTEALAKRNRAMRLVMDNVNQGFLTTGERGVLAQERSRMIDVWFGPYQESTTLWDYMRRLDGNFADMCHLGHEALTDDVLPRQLCLDQLPTRLRVNGRDFAFSYRTIGDEDSGPQRSEDDAADQGPLQGLLIVINDITEQVARARQEAEQSEQLAIFRGFTTDRSGFLSFFEEATRIVDSLRQGESNLETRLRLYHTLKGNAGLAEFGTVTELCHQAEDALAEKDEAALEVILQALVARWKSLGETLATLVRERGRDAIDIQARDLDEVLKTLRDIVPRSTWERMSDWRLEPTERPLNRLGDYARTLAHRLGRGDLEVSVESGGLRLDPQRWNGLWSELVHVIRNAVDHGLEPVEERRSHGKRPRPRLRLATIAVGDRLLLEIEDDGQGIDWQAVKRVAAERGLAAETTEELTEALLSPLVTTRDAVTATSGRGVGLASVRQRVQSLGGRIAIITRRGQGTTFQFNFPLSGSPPPAADRPGDLGAGGRAPPPAAA